MLENGPDLLGTDGRRPHRDGFTLIEVVAALVVFAVGVLMAARLADTLSQQVVSSGLRTEVVAAAQEKMDEMQRLAYDSLTIGTSSESLTIEGHSYERTTTVADYGTRILSVEVSVQPTDSVGPSQNLLSYTYDPW